jgi:hypothetical protein
VSSDCSIPLVTVTSLNFVHGGIVTETRIQNWAAIMSSQRAYRRGVKSCCSQKQSPHAANAVMARSITARLCRLRCSAAPTR